MYLELTVSSESSYTTPTPPHLNCTISYSGVDAASIDLDPSNNLLTRTALYVLRCHGQHQFPAYTKVHIHNPIPLGRGLGSSGAAVVGGVMLADVCGKLNLSKARVLGKTFLRRPIDLADSRALETPRQTLPQPSPSCPHQILVTETDTQLPP